LATPLERGVDIEASRPRGAGCRRIRYGCYSILLLNLRPLVSLLNIVCLDRLNTPVADAIPPDPHGQARESGFNEIISGIGSATAFRACSIADEKLHINVEVTLMNSALQLRAPGRA